MVTRRSSGSSTTRGSPESQHSRKRCSGSACRSFRGITFVGMKRLPFHYQLVSLLFPHKEELDHPSLHIHIIQDAEIFDAQLIVRKRVRPKFFQGSSELCRLAYKAIGDSLRDDPSLACRKVLKSPFGLVGPDDLEFHSVCVLFRVVCLDRPPILTP